MKRRILFPALVTAVVVLSPTAAPNGADALAGDPGGGSGSSQQPDSPSIDSAGTCASTHTFSSGTTLFETCITVDGNMAEFKVGGTGGPWELIRSGVVLEGYVLCTGAGTSGYDAGGYGENGFNDPVVNQPGGAGTLPLTITRTTTDGKFSLVQKFVPTGARVVTITMSVTNTSGGDLAGVKLARVGDTDIGSDLGNDQAFNTRRSATAFDTPNGAQLTLTATSRGRPVTTSVGSYPTGYNDCASLAGASIYGPTDLMVKEVYNLGTVNAGATRDVVFAYSGD